MRQVESAQNTFPNGEVAIEGAILRKTKRLFALSVLGMITCLVFGVLMTFEAFKIPPVHVIEPNRESHLAVNARPAEVDLNIVEAALFQSVEAIFTRDENGWPEATKNYVVEEVFAQFLPYYESLKSRFPAGYSQQAKFPQNTAKAFYVGPNAIQMGFQVDVEVRSTVKIIQNTFFLRATFRSGEQTPEVPSGWRMTGIEPMTRISYFEDEDKAKLIEKTESK